VKRRPSYPYGTALMRAAGLLPGPGRPRKGPYRPNWSLLYDIGQVSKGHPNLRRHVRKGESGFAAYLRIQPKYKRRQLRALQREVQTALSWLINVLHEPAVLKHIQKHFPDADEEKLAQVALNLLRNMPKPK
jgi:hypothetical protein